jgi:hypothetical protein
VGFRQTADAVAAVGDGEAAAGLGETAGAVTVASMLGLALGEGLGLTWLAWLEQPVNSTAARAAAISGP